MSWAIPTKKDDGGKFEKAPPGNHPAVLVAIIDLGNQWQEPYSHPKPGEKPQVAKYQHKMYFVYELVTKKMTGKVNENHVIAVDLTFSMYETAKMRKWVESRLGKKLPDGVAYDITQELGQPVLLNVQLKGDYPRIEGVSAVPEGLPVPPPLHKPVAWKMGDPADALPPWLPYLYGRPIADVIRDSRELKGAGPAQPQQPQQPQAQQPAAPQQASAPRPRMGAKPVPPAEPPAPHSRWHCYDTEGKEWVPQTAKDFEDFYQEWKIDPATLRVYPDGATEHAAKSAAEYGFPPLSPF